MQIELLDTFLDLVETRSFHRTAERMGVTQSTVSARVLALEEAVGGRLFSRSRAGTQLTTEGLKFQAHARGLRHAWTEAQRSVAPSGTAAVTLRIGIQHDLALGRIGSWLAVFRKAVPDSAFYFEPDYSVQMCQDVQRGALDFALLYSPQPMPDLHFVSLGEVNYRLVSSTGTARAALSPASYVRASVSPAFDMAHAQALPEMVATPVATGQNAAMAELLAALGGAGFVMDTTAAEMVAGGRFAMVEDVEPISQPVYAVMHQRHRTQRSYRRVVRTMQKHFAIRA